jgi:hypothetical protein
MKISTIIPPVRPIDYDSASAYADNLLRWLRSIADGRLAFDLGDVRVVFSYNGVNFYKDAKPYPYGVLGVTSIIAYRNGDIHLLFGTRKPIDDSIGYFADHDQLEVRRPGLCANVYTKRVEVSQDGQIGLYVRKGEDLIPMKV